MPDPREPVTRTLGRPLFRASAPPLVLAAAPDGGLWAVGEDGALTRWDRDGEATERAFLCEHEALWAFAEAAPMLASASDEVAIWDVAEAFPVRRWPAGGWVTALALSSRGGYVAAGLDSGRVCAWRADTGHSAFALHADVGAIAALAWSPDSHRLLAVGEGRTLRLIDALSGRVEREWAGGADRVAALAWHPDGDWFAAASWGGAVRLYNPDLPAPIGTLSGPAEPLVALRFSPDGRSLAVLSDAGTVAVWPDPLTGEPPRLLSASGDEFRDLAFARDGLRLAAASGDARLTVWDMPEGEPVAGAADPADDAGHRVAVLGPPVRVASAADGRLTLWGAADGEGRAFAPAREGVRCVAASAEGDWVVWAGGGGSARLADARTGKRTREFDCGGGPLGPVAAAADGRTFAVARPDDGSVWVWDTGQAEAVHVLAAAADGDTPTALAFSPDGKTLYVAGIDRLQSSGTDGGVCVWDLEARECRATLEGGALALALTPDGSMLVVALRDGGVARWEVPALVPVTPVIELPEPAVALAVSPDGALLAAACRDQTVRLWDIRAGTPLLSRLWPAPVTDIAFADGGALLVAANADGTVALGSVRRLLAGE